MVLWVHDVSDIPIDLLKVTAGPHWYVISDSIGRGRLVWSLGPITNGMTCVGAS